MQSWTILNVFNSQDRYWDLAFNQIHSNQDSRSLASGKPADRLIERLTRKEKSIGPRRYMDDAILIHDRIRIRSKRPLQRNVRIENTILMPLVRGSDWANVADKVRAGKINLTSEQRLLLCRNLSEKVSILERSNVSHRDLSSTNVFVDTNTWNVHLIDWDSIFHSSLTFPPNTTFGTNGYVAPFVRVNGSEDPHIRWRCGADRFSLAVLNVEFLCVE